MSEVKAASKWSGWVKTSVTSIGGILSGAALMYLTPLLNSVIKPTKPVANFAHQVSGLTVTLNNRSVGGSQGWWDFGDGSALEPFDPKKDVVTHSYTRPGSYNVKLSLQNVLGEQSERMVAIALDPGTPGLLPSIEAFEVVPLRPDSVAPATFRIVSKVKNADLVAWGFGDEPLKTETVHEPDKYVTFQEPGYHTLRLVAFQGKQVVEKSHVVLVDVGESGQPMATVQVFYEGAQVQRKKATAPLALQWDAREQGDTCPVSREFAVERGWQIGEAKLLPLPKEQLRQAKLEISADRTRLRLDAEMVKPKAWLTARAVAAPQCVAQVELVLERRTAKQSRPGELLAYDLTVPGATQIPLPPPPPGMEVQGKRIALEIKHKNKPIWNGPGLPVGAKTVIHNRLVRITAAEQDGTLRVDVVEANKP